MRARESGVETHHVADDVVRHLTSTVTPQALVGVSAFLDVGLDEALEAAFGPDPGGCVALLHEVRDPGNAGTVLRSADAAGAGGGRVLRDLGRRLQPEDGPRLGWLDLPPAGRA